MLYACAQPEFHSREFAKAFKISHNVITAMHELGLIQKVGNGKYCWIIRREPLPTDVIAIRKRLSAYNTTARQSNGQLSIKPIKSTKSVASKSVEVDSKHTPYPLMDVVISFFAGMIAAGFISLIWK
jgi:hypothetical protein